VPVTRDGHETLKLETETKPRRWPYQPRRDVCRSRDVKIGLHVIMIADVNLLSRPLIIIIIIIRNLQGGLTLP